MCFSYVWRWIDLEEKNFSCVKKILVFGIRKKGIYWRVSESVYKLWPIEGFKPVTCGLANSVIPHICNIHATRVSGARQHMNSARDGKFQKKKRRTPNTELSFFHLKNFSTENNKKSDLQRRLFQLCNKASSSDSSEVKMIWLLIPGKQHRKKTEYIWKAERTVS